MFHYSRRFSDQRPFLHSPCRYGKFMCNSHVYPDIKPSAVTFVMHGGTKSLQPTVVSILSENPINLV